MTYGVLKAITTGLLTGDNVLPTGEGVLEGLVEYALTTVAMQADSLHLMTLSTTAGVLRLAQGDYLIRRPVAPITVTAAVDALAVDATVEDTTAAKAADTLATINQLIDIDEELTFAVARYVASYVSREKGGIHIQAAERVILDYNAKTWEILDQMLPEALDTFDPSYQTLWNSLSNTFIVVSTTFPSDLNGGNGAIDLNDGIKIKDLNTI